MKIVVATGGSGGHIFPALQTAQVLKNCGNEIIFIGSLGMGQEKIRAQGFDAINIDAKGLTNKSLVGLFSFCFVMMGALIQATGVLRKIRPDKVIGFGGYSSFAVVLSAWLSNIPTMIHEQNVVPGKANRFLARFVKKIAISFPQTQKYLGKDKTVWTGCPCQHHHLLESKEKILQKFSLDANKNTLLVLGGSQGSQKLNEIFFEMISSFGKESNIQAIHMTGKKDFIQYLSKYRDKNLPVRVFEFISPIEEAYALADVVIARSGAATVCELGFFGIPSILIPYPLADGHQKFNAEILSELGLAQIIEQKHLTRESLKEAVESVLSSSLGRDIFKNKTKSIFKQNPSYDLALAVENL